MLRSSSLTKDPLVRLKLSISLMVNCVDWLKNLIDSISSSKNSTLKGLG